MKSIYIKEETLPEAWEKAVIKTWEIGDSFPTQYDKPNDPNSRDVACLIHITDPTKEPCIHRAFPGGLDDLEKYRSEVLYGVHDHWVDPKAGKWEYTYHQRLFEYDVLVKNDQNLIDGVIPLKGACHLEFINQIKRCIEMLKECPYTRRAQAVTWKAWEDLGIHDPACLQRLWFRGEESLPREALKKIDYLHGMKDAACTCGDYDMVRPYVRQIIDIKDNTPKVPMLNMNVHIRSNDGFKAAFMNFYAFIELQKMVAKETGMEVGSYIHMADSFHIYGSYFDEFKGFLDNLKNREFKDRVWDTKFAIPFFIDGCDVLLAEEDMPETKKQLVKERKAYLEKLL